MKVKRNAALIRRVANYLVEHTSTNAAGFVKGHTVADLAKEFDVSRQTIQNIVRENPGFYESKIIEWPTRWCFNYDEVVSLESAMVRAETEEIAARASAESKPSGQPKPASGPRIDIDESMLEALENDPAAAWQILRKEMANNETIAEIPNPAKAARFMATMAYHLTTLTDGN